MQNKNIKKIVALGTGLFAFATFAFTACNKEKEVVIPPYNAATRTPTDEGEIAITPVTDYETYNNPIELYDGDGMAYYAGDPFVLRHDGKYYLYVSSDGARYRVNDAGAVGVHACKIPFWVSDNMVDWVWGGFCFEPDKKIASSDTSYPSNITFAPEVVYYNGWFYMCASQRGRGHYFYRAASPAGPFTLIDKVNYGMGIDGSFYLHDDNKLYFISANDAISEKRITAKEISFPEDASGNVSVVIDNRSNSGIVETAYLNGWTEGPGVIRRNGYSYLTYTGNHVDSASYRVAYSSAKGNHPFTGLTVKSNNVTLASSGMDENCPASYNNQGGTVSFSTFRGTGHSSNFAGPNLDSVYTAYHIADRDDHANSFGSGSRKYAVTQYFTNQSYLFANGLGNYTRMKPAQPDCILAESELVAQNEYMLSPEATENVFTAELNLMLANGKGSAVIGFSSASDYAEISVNGNTLSYARISGGQKSAVASATVPVSTNKEAVHTVKAVNGAHELQIYYDNMLVITTDKTVSAGKVGYTGGATPSSTVYQNDAFGTSDFDAPKDLTGTFAAFAYMKGKNRGYSFKNAQVRTNGVRQGEAESTKYVPSQDATALELSAGEWVKYLVEAREDGVYSLSFLLGKLSRGCVYEIIVDNEDIYHYEIPADEEFGEAEYANVFGGLFECGKGLHTVKLRVYAGKLDLVNISAQRDADPLGDFEDALTQKNDTFDQQLGRSSNSAQGMMTSASDDRTLIVAGRKGMGNYEFSVDVRLVSDQGGGGIMFRMNNYSYTNYRTTATGDCYTGYYLNLTGNAVILNKQMWNVSESMKLVKPSGDISLRGGKKVTVTVRAVNGSLIVALNGEEIISVFDPEAFSTGYIALYSQKDTSIVYSNFQYTELI